MIRSLLRFNALAGHVAAVILWLLVLIVTGDVVARLLGSSLLWASEVSVYLLVSAMFLGLGYTYDAGGHFSITLVVERLPRSKRVIAEIATSVVALAFASVFTWGGVTLVLFARSISIASPTLLQTPMWIPYGTIFIGGLTLSISLIARLAALLPAATRGTEVDFRKEHSV